MRVKKNPGLAAGVMIETHLTGRLASILGDPLGSHKSRQWSSEREI